MCVCVEDCQTVHVGRAQVLFAHTATQALCVCVSDKDGPAAVVAIIESCAHAVNEGIRKGGGWLSMLHPFPNSPTRANESLAARGGRR